MTEGQQLGLRVIDDGHGPSDQRVDALASRALSVVAERKARTIRAPLPHFVELLSDAALSPEREPFFPILHRMAQSGITPEEIADLYVPAVARRMGDLWCEDEVGFAAVTIGSARLQGMLRELGPEWRADAVAPSRAATILVLVEDGAQHTLGATVLAGQLRRRGLSVRLNMGARPEEIAAILRRYRFDAVLLSASLGESLETLRKIVDAVRAVLPQLPVLLGGTILSEGPEIAEIKARTGADAVTNDLNEALELCGLTTLSRMPRDARGT
jgi:methanogenic corrinoid protein MtbC1